MLIETEHFILDDANTDCASGYGGYLSHAEGLALRVKLDSGVREIARITPDGSGSRISFRDNGFCLYFRKPYCREAIKMVKAAESEFAKWRENENKHRKAR